MFTLDQQSAILTTIRRLEKEVRSNQYGFASTEVNDGFGLVWLEATRTNSGRVIWSLDEKRIGKENILPTLIERHKEAGN